MSNLPYDEEYLNKIFAQRPDLKEKINKIVNKLQGLSGNMDQNALFIIAKDDLKELINKVLEAFAKADGDIPKIGDLTPEQTILFFKHIEEISKVISEGIFEDEKILLSLIVDHIAEAYMITLQTGKSDPNSLSAKDKKRIKEELQRMFEYEIYKKLNPERLAGETAKDNFLNNMQVGGIALARQYEGKEYIQKLRPEEIKALQFENEQFKHDFKVERTSSGQSLTSNVSQIRGSDKNLSKG